MQIEILASYPVTDIRLIFYTIITLIFFYFFEILHNFQSTFQVHRHGKQSRMS